MNTGGTHWIVKLNRRNRSVFFALFFLSLIPHLLDIRASVLMWVLLALSLLLYPHVVYLWARRSSDSLRAELHNLRLDGFLFGLWMAAWGFPMWISFGMALSATQNVVMFEGAQTLWKAVVAIAAGASLGALTFGLELRPETNLWTSLMLMCGLMGYVLVSANYAYQRGMSLRDSRQQLGEQLVQISALQVQMEELARRDPLTGAYNRRHLDQALDEALTGARTSGQPLSLLMIDIDHFKHINDSHGHSAGDRVICHLVDLLRERFSERDEAVYRYGGEEFLVVLPGTSLAQAATQADAFRAHFAASTTPFEDAPLSTTLSIGVAGFPEHPPHAGRLIKLADQALYAAKLGGRNRVVSSADVRVVP